MKIIAPLFRLRAFNVASQVQPFARIELARLRFRATASVAEPRLRQLAAFNIDARST